MRTHLPGIRFWLLSMALSLLLLSGWGSPAFGIPARPGSFSYVQPDGTTLLLERHGDEFFHWTTLAGSDQVVELDADGFWKPVSLDVAQRNRAFQRRSSLNRVRRQKGTAPSRVNLGERRIPVILVQFSDLPFKIEDPAARFDAMLNSPGYNSDGATGSVRDFFYDNSDGRFIPKFEVFGPVTLSQKMSYYGRRDEDALLAVMEGCQLLDAQIDFSRYDSDGDGYVDMVLMYFAGHNEAEGASSSTIWPHQWYLSEGGYSLTLDGTQIDNYFCTSELQGSSGSMMCAIGTTCHEFSHSLGLPDFYDTDSWTGGTAGGLYEFSTMCSGCYNNYSRTPPYFNAVERVMLGWMEEDAIVNLPTGPVEIAPLQSGIAYKSLTSTDGEFFVYECRNGCGWDAPLPKGMVVYHADQSKTRSVGPYTPYELWADWEATNRINASGSHPCFYVVPAANQSSLYYVSSDLGSYVFPGSKKITTFEPVDWDNHATGTKLSLIIWSEATGSIRFESVNPEVKVLSGRVTDRSGAPVSGALITVSEHDASALRFCDYRRGDGSMLRRIAPAPEDPFTLQAETDADGCYRIDLSDVTCSQIHVSVSCSGYVSQSKDVTVSERGITLDFILKKIGESSVTHFRKYDPSATLLTAGDVNSMGGVCFTAEELAPYVGELLVEAAFFVYPSSAQAVYIVVDFGEERALTYQIPQPVYNDYDVYDLSPLGIRIPEGKDMHIGYGFVEAAEPRPLVIALGSGSLEFADFSPSWTPWRQVPACDLVLDFSLMDTGVEFDGTLASMGFASIDPGTGAPYAAGSTFPLQVLLPSGDKVSSVSWRYDGEPVSGTELTLRSGRHVVEATLRHDNGRCEILELELIVN